MQALSYPGERFNPWDEGERARNAGYARALRGAEAATLRDYATDLLDASTNAPFAYTDACVKRVPHVGHDAEATRAVTEAVADFLRALLKP